MGDIALFKVDNETAKTSWRAVTNTFRDWHEETITFKVEDENGIAESITTTAEHPFYVVDTGWVSAGDIDAGTVISGSDQDNNITITDIKVNQQAQWAYNLTVDTDHTYFVGETNMWVHNVCGLRAAKGEVFYKNTMEAKRAAEKLGFVKIKGTPNGEAIFYNKKKNLYISRDVGSGDGKGAHNGGVWKMAKSIKGLGSKKTRLGTFDSALNKIGG